MDILNLYTDFGANATVQLQQSIQNLEAHLEMQLEQVVVGLQVTLQHSEHMLGFWVLSSTLTFLLARQCVEANRGQHFASKPGCLTVQPSY